MYMSYSTSLIVDEFINNLSAGALYSRNSIPKEFSKILDNFKISKSSQLSEYHRILNHMSRIGLIKREKLSDGDVYIILTSKAKQRLRSSQISSIEIKNPSKWDGKWRVLSFDIPRDMRSKRYEFLRELHRLGFEKVLQSMWVYPFPCESEIKQIASLLSIQEGVMYMEATLDEDNHKYLEKHFAYLIK